MNIITEYLNPEYFDIDTSDIWIFERLYFLHIEKNIDLGKRIINEIQSLIIKNIEPSYDVTLYDNGDENAKRKYSRDLNSFFEDLSSPEKIFDLEFFFIIMLAMNIMQM